MKWKRLSEQKPDKLSDVLVYGGKDTHPYIAWAFYNSDGKFATHDGIDKNITHWMPLPDAPQDNNVEILNNNQQSKCKIRARYSEHGVGIL